MRARAPLPERPGVAIHGTAGGAMRPRGRERRTSARQILIRLKTRSGIAQITVITTHQTGLT